jgi:hypothetical protein
MTGAGSARRVETERHDQLLTVAQAGDYLGTGERFPRPPHDCRSAVTGRGHGGRPMAGIVVRDCTFPVLSPKCLPPVPAVAARRLIRPECSRRSARESGSRDDGPACGGAHGREPLTFPASMPNRLMGERTTAVQPLPSRITSTAMLPAEASR